MPFSCPFYAKRACWLFSLHGCHGKHRSIYEQERHPRNKAAAIARLRGMRLTRLGLRAADVSRAALVARVPRFVRAALVARVPRFARAALVVRVIGIGVRVPWLV